MKIMRLIGAIWAIVGITLILADAVLRVAPHVFDAFALQLTPLQWIIMIFWCAFMWVGEGYRGFQKQLAPRFAARLERLIREGRIIDCRLAPLYCLEYYRAPRRRIIGSWALTIGIVTIIVIVRTLSQPWRGIIDSGVVLGLAYGLLWIYICTYRTLKTDYIPVRDASITSM